MDAMQRPMPPAARVVHDLRPNQPHVIPDDTHHLGRIQNAGVPLPIVEAEPEELQLQPNQNVHLIALEPAEPQAPRAPLPQGLRSRVVSDS